MLRTKLLDDCHIGANIVIWMEEMLSSYDISVDNVIAFVHDSGANINLAGHQLHDKYSWHTEDTRSSFVLRQACVLGSLK